MWEAAIVLLLWLLEGAFEGDRGWRWNRPETERHGWTSVNKRLSTLRGATNGELTDSILYCTVLEATLVLQYRASSLLASIFMLALSSTWHIFIGYSVHQQSCVPTNNFHYLTHGFSASHTLVPLSPHHVILNLPLQVANITHSKPFFAPSLSPPTFCS